MVQTESRMKSQIFRNLFSSYVMIISICYLLYSGLIIYEGYVINQEQMRSENQMKAREAVSVVEQRLMAAQNIVSRINTSSTIKKLYTNVLESETVLDSYTLYSIMNDLARVATSSGRLDIDDVVIFIDDYNKAYSATGVVPLANPYVHSSKILPAVEHNQIQSALNAEAGGRLTFLRDNFLYMDSYTYSNGSRRGIVCVSFDADALSRDMEKILGEGSGYQIRWRDKVVLDNALMAFDGNIYEMESNISDMLYMSFQMPRSPGLSHATVILIILLLAGFLISGGFIVLAYHFTNRYYEPIQSIESLMGVQGQEAEDETERLLTGLKSLIGERNGYRERMITIAPYAHTGMLHGVLTGNMGQEAITVLCEKDYLDLKKPYFVVSVVNFAYKSTDVDLNVHKKRIGEIFPKLVSVFSTEETRLSYYRKDSFNVFMVANSDSDQPLDELFYQMHKSIVEFMADEDCLVTFGVDEVRDQLSQLQSACAGAMKALDGMVLNGRGEVYFYEQEEGQTGMNYYFPKNAAARLVKILKEKNMEEVKRFLNDIYVKNLERSRNSAISVEDLIDELHVLTLKCIKELNERNTTYINVNRINQVATLEEVFDYYAAVFDAVEKEVQEDDRLEAEELDRAIIDYIKEHYCNSELSLQYLTDKFGVSNKYISLLCKNELGRTYLQYVQEQRIGLAVKLLKTTDDTLEKIGEICGYTSTLTFRRNFKMITGMNPSDFRNQ